MDRQMYQWAQKNPNDPIAKQILALGPGLGIHSEYQGEFTLDSGKTISVTAYEQLASQWQSKAGNQSYAPIVSVNSYGGGGAASAYDTPGMDSSTFLSRILRNPCCDKPKRRVLTLGETRSRSAQRMV